MKEITREKDAWGQDVIYVGECDRFLYEEQGVDINEEDERLYDIMSSIEDYYNESNSMKYDYKLKKYVDGGGE